MLRRLAASGRPRDHWIREAAELLFMLRKTNGFFLPDGRTTGNLEKAIDAWIDPGRDEVAVLWNDSTGKIISIYVEYVDAVEEMRLHHEAIESESTRLKKETQELDPLETALAFKKYMKTSSGYRRMRIEEA